MGRRSTVDVEREISGDLQEEIWQGYVVTLPNPEPTMSDGSAQEGGFWWGAGTGFLTNLRAILAGCARAVGGDILTLGLLAQ
jgi:hypothetical protein